MEGFDSIAVENDNEHFYVQDGCLIWRDKKALMLAVKGAKIPADDAQQVLYRGENVGKVVLIVKE